MSLTVVGFGVVEVGDYVVVSLTVVGLGVVDVGY